MCFSNDVVFALMYSVIVFFHLLMAYCKAFCGFPQSYLRFLAKPFAVFRRALCSILG